MGLTYFAELGSIYGDKSRDFGTERAEAERCAKAWSRGERLGDLLPAGALSPPIFAHVVALRGRERVGQRVFCGGKVSRPEGEYL